MNQRENKSTACFLDLRLITLALNETEQDRNNNDR